MGGVARKVSDPSPLVLARHAGDVWAEPATRRRSTAAVPRDIQFRINPRVARYRIKSQTDGHERVVREDQLAVRA